MFSKIEKKKFYDIKMNVKTIRLVYPISLCYRFL